MTTFAMSTLLDPSFKDAHIRDLTAKATVIRKVYNLITQQCREKGSSDSDSYSTQVAGAELSVWSQHDTIVQKIWK